MGLEPATPSTAVGRRRAEHDIRLVDITSANLTCVVLRRADLISTVWSQVSASLCGGQELVSQVLLRRGEGRDC